MDDARLERWGLAAVALGALLRVASPFVMDLGYDANAYVAMAHGWARTGNIVLAWGDVLTFHPSGEGPSHHFPPMYPLFLGVVFKLFGYGLAQAKLAAVAMSLAALAVVYATTRDLYGRRVAALSTGVVALYPFLFWLTGMGFSENLALAFFTLTMWAIVKSLDREPYVVLAGLFAGLAYLTRSSMGAFFLVAGLGGLAWRLWHRGWRGVARPWYALAVATFGAIVLAWAWRNVALFGWPNWETSPGSRGIPRWIRAHPLDFAAATLWRLPYMATVFAPFVLLWPEARASLRKWRDEHTSALWLAVVLTWLLAVFFSASYLSMGLTWAEALRLDNLRYAVIGVVPLAWALLREGADARRLAALAGVLLAGCVVVASYPPHYLPTHAARALDPWLEEGDGIEVAGSGKYAFYAYLTRPETVRVWVTGYGAQPSDAEFIITQRPLDAPGYVVLAEERMTHPWWPVADEYVAVLGREDVVRARGVALGEMRAGW